jgi:DNA polymerase-3 subunit epsilon
MIHRFQYWLQHRFAPPLSSFVEEARRQRLVKEWSREQYVRKLPLEQLPVTFLDTETTGFNPELGDEIFSIAAIKRIDQRVVPAYTTHVRIQGAIPADIQMLTGVKDEDLLPFSPIQDILPVLLDYIESTVVVGFHIGHDIRFLNHYLWSLRRERMHHRFLDLHQLFHCLIPERPKWSLEEACVHFNITMAKRHAAYDDALAVFHLWNVCIELCKSKSIHNLEELYHFLAVENM